MQKALLLRFTAESASHCRRTFSFNSYYTRIRAWRACAERFEAAPRAGFHHEAQLLETAAATTAVAAATATAASAAATAS